MRKPRLSEARDLIEPVMAELVANGIAQIQSRQGCSIDLRWEGSLGNGSRHLGP